MTEIVVLDAGPLIHLDELGCLNLLADFEVLLVPEQVWLEVKQHRPGALSNPTVTLKKIDVAIDSTPTFQSLVATMLLDAGEQAALSLMLAYPNAILLTDDTAARLAAQSLNYRVHGTIGILIRSIRRKQRTKDEIIEVLRSIPARSTLHVRNQFLNKIIDEVVQSP